MKLLKELADIVTRQRVEKVKLIDISLEDEPGSHYGKFYQALHAGEIKTDNDAANLFYGTDSLDDRYRKLKSRFKKRLLNYLFFMDVNTGSFSDYSRAYHTCQKNLILCRILANQSANYAFRKIAQQTLRHAVKFDLHDVITPLTSEMLSAFSLYGKTKEYQETLEIFEKSRVLLEKEYDAARLTEQVIINFATSNKKTEELIELARDHFEKTKSLLVDNDSYKLNYQYFYLGGIYYQVIYDFQSLIRLCDEVEAYFEQNDQFVQPMVLSQFYLMKMSAMLNLKKHDEGITTIKRSLDYFSVGSNNWMLAMETYFLLLMQSGKYEQAASIFLEVVNHSRFKTIQEYKREKWRILYAYLHYIFEVEDLDKGLLQNKYIHGFNVEQFLSNTPIASKDKTGLNVAILVLQIQYHFKEHQTSKIFDKTDALSMYAYRYLNKKENSRAYMYIRLLLAAEKDGFVYNKVVTKTSKLFQKLKSELDSYSAEWEILPYEVLWEQALTFMKEQDMAPVRP